MTACSADASPSLLAVDGIQSLSDMALGLSSTLVSVKRATGRESFPEDLLGSHLTGTTATLTASESKCSATH